MKYNLIKLCFLAFNALLWLNPTISFSQTDYDNHRKYWYYRSRLTNDFMKVGLGQGESMVFNQRGYWGADFNDAIARLNLGDGTSTLGYYIGLLATEYYLLSQNGQSTTKVKHELFCALNAINRLDAVAETLDHNNLTALNGFFVRDDISKTMIDVNYKHFNYFDNGGNAINNSPSRGFASKFNTGSREIKSSWQNAVEDGKSSDMLYESQDQVYNLLFGIAMVNKFVPDTETDDHNPFGYGSGETSLTKEARNIAGRMIDHVRWSKNISTGNSCVYEPGSTGWTIRNPNTCEPVEIGGSAQLFAYPLAEIECLIKKGFQSNNGTNFGALAVAKLCGENGYHNVWSQSLLSGFSPWNVAAATPFDKIDTRVFVENLSAICNCVYGTELDQYIDKTITYLVQSPLTSWLGWLLGFIWKWVSQTFTTLIPGLTKNITESAININAYTVSNPMDHGPIARAILHNGSYTPNPNTFYNIKTLLDVAPCDDIYAFPGGIFGHREWSSSDRLDHPERKWGSGSNNGFYGEYPAIDFMLYHNLWYIYQLQHGANPNVVDLSDVTIDNPSNLGCDNVNAYETINATNTNLSSINCTSPTVWRAGKSIYFGAGTSITGNGSTTSGPNFHAYIQKFDCATDIGVFRLAQTDSTQLLNNNDTQINSSLVNDSYATNNVKYHTVSYPPNYTAMVNTSQPIDDLDEHNQNLITELPIVENPIDIALKAAYPDYSKELFIKPTVTTDNVKAYFTMEDNEIAFITVMDMNGKKIYSNNDIKPSDTGLTIDLSAYAAGSYLLKFTTTKGTNKTHKIIKQ